MNNPSEPTSTTPPAEHVGQHLHADLIPLGCVCVGGITQLMASVDEKSGFVGLVPQQAKATTANCEGIDQLVSFYHQHGHEVKHITTDGENALKAMKPHLQARGITFSSTPAGLHEKRIERYIQTLKKRAAAIQASLDYVVPPQLEAELYIAAAISMNSSSNTSSSPLTPFHLVTGRKPRIPQFHFGQVGLFKGVNKDQPTEWGIFLGYGDAPNSFRAYFPFRRGVQSRRKFLPHPVVPKEWGFAPRIGKPGRSLPSVNQPLGTNPVVDAPPPGDADFDPPSGVVTLPHAQPQSLPDHVADPAPIPPPHGLSAPKGVTALPLTPAPPSAPTSTADGASKGVSMQSLSEPTAPPAIPPATTTAAESVSSRPRRAAAQHKGWVHGRHDEGYTLSSQAYQVDELPLNVRIQLSNYFAFYGDYPTAAKLQGKTWDPSFEEIHAYRVSFNAALKMTDRRKEVIAAIADEIHNMMKNKVVKPIKPHKVTAAIRKRTIPAHMFLKFKYKANGDYDKAKARLVAGGNFQDPDTIGETFAPTVNPITVKTHLQITAAEKLHLSAYDIKGAFLIPSMDDDDAKPMLSSTGLSCILSLKSSSMKMEASCFSLSSISMAQLLHLTSSTTTSTTR